jgi:signal transduction histidine kinase
MAEKHFDISLITLARLLLIYWIGSWVVLPIYDVLTGSGQPTLAPAQIATLLSIHVLALGLLTWPAVRRATRRWFFPLLIAISAAPFFVERVWYLLIAEAPNPPAGAYWHALTLREDLILLVLLAAWQHPFRYVARYIVALSVLDWGITVVILGSDQSELADFTRVVLSRAVIYLLVGYGVTWLRERQSQQESELLAANRQQAEANRKLANYAATVEQLSTSRERNRLARELHDTLAHSLSALTVQIEAISSLWDVDLPAARRMLTRADETTRSGLTEARRSLQALRATPLEEFGLGLALRELAELAAQRADMRLDLAIQDIGGTLSSEEEQGIYRIAQEALENVVRHARASRVRLQLCLAESAVLFSVEDDGVGFVTDIFDGAESHFGIRGMYERALIAGGALQVLSEPGRGTRVGFVLGVAS